jgi:hypothetical protein
LETRERLKFAVFCCSNAIGEFQRLLRPRRPSLVKRARNRIFGLHRWQGTQSSLVCELKELVTEFIIVRPSWPIHQECKVFGSISVAEAKPIG